jgi:hypothetical protein
MKLPPLKHLIITLLLLILLILIFWRIRGPMGIPNQLVAVPANKPAPQITPFLVKPTGEGQELLVGERNNPNFTTYVVQTNAKANYSIERDPAKFTYPNLKGFLGKYGQPDLELWGPFAASSGYKSYIFLNPALIVIAHPISGSVTQIWHIEANLSQTTFTNLYQDQFSQIKPTPPNQH